MEAYCQSVAWCHWEKKGGVQIRTGSTVESVDLTRSPIFVHESEWITVIINIIIIIDIIIIIIIIIIVIIVIIIPALQLHERVLVSEAAVK